MTSGRVAVRELMASADPLSDEACGGLLEYREEDELVDFKESFDLKSDKAWIDLAVDCVAFADTEGGYVVLGVRDRTWEQIGLPSDVMRALADSKRVLEKINRNLVPTLGRVRTRSIERDGKQFVLLHVPCSADHTHIIESNLDWSPSSGRSVPLVAKGAISTRRVASNQVLTSADFELLVERRL